MIRLLPLALLALLASFSLIRAAEPTKPAPGNRLFEMRTYYTHPGRLDALNARFRDHTNKLFVKHGMELVGYWTPQGKPDTLVYILAYPSREAREASWKAFNADPDWKAAREASEKDGKIVDKVESVFLDPTDYSPIK
ncbi:MAG TPA: NIPSNAP family protein [Isosphaeraceae bacterium]